LRVDVVHWLHSQVSVESAAKLRTGLSHESRLRLGRPRCALVSTNGFEWLLILALVRGPPSGWVAALDRASAPEPV
jgi:hypothetical protein